MSSKSLYAEGLVPRWWCDWQVIQPVGGGSHSHKERPERVYWVPVPFCPLCFQTTVQWAGSTHCVCHDVLPHHRPKARGLCSHVLKPLRLSSLPLFSSRSQVPCHPNGKWPEPFLLPAYGSHCIQGISLFYCDSVLNKIAYFTPFWGFF